MGTGLTGAAATREHALADERVARYGPRDGQEGTLHLPAVSHPPVVCLLHGGFWRMPYGREQMTAVARDLARRGFAVWNLEYRRLGAAGGGWPGTFDDVVTGIGHLAALAADGIALDLQRVAVVGHSAGGHLALWSVSREATRRHGRGTTVRIVGVVGQAPVADLERAHALGLGRGAVAELLGGGPADHPERYEAGSPRAMLPLGVPQLIMHGARDEAIPIEHSRAYCEAAYDAGDRVELTELPDAGHMDFLDPESEAHDALCGWLAGALGVEQLEG